MRELRPRRRGSAGAAPSPSVPTMPSGADGWLRTRPWSGGHRWTPRCGRSATATPSRRVVVRHLCADRLRPDPPGRAGPGPSPRGAQEVMLEVWRLATLQPTRRHGVGVDHDDRPSARPSTASARRRPSGRGSSRSTGSLPAPAPAHDEAIDALDRQHVRVALDRPICSGPRSSWPTSAASASKDRDPPRHPARHREDTHPRRSHAAPRHPWRAHVTGQGT